MELLAIQRWALIHVARRWLGTLYDTHGDEEWRDIEASPTRLDNATFACRTAMEALAYRANHLAADPCWLIDNLAMLDTPQPGDLVAYSRAATHNERALGRERMWHVMMYLGSGLVIGACDLAGRVIERPLDYEPELGERRWELLDHRPFRRLELDATRQDG